MKRLKQLPKNNARKLKVALGGNSNLDFMIPGLVCGLYEFGYQADYKSLDYDSWLQTVLSEKYSFDFWVIWMSSMAASVGGTSRQGFDAHKIAQAASIIAKVHRDRLMSILSKKYHHFNWDKNSGYGTQNHIKEIIRIGPSIYHRKSFEPIKSLIHNK